MLTSVHTINENMIQQLGHPHTNQFFPEVTTTPPQSWQEGVANTHDNWMIQDVKTPEHRHVLAESIRRGTAIGVNDGSFCPHARKGLSAAATGHASSQHGPRPPT